MPSPIFQLMLLVSLVPLPLYDALLISATASTSSSSSSNSDEQYIPCLVGMCTSRHQRLLAERGAEPSATVDYCLLLKDYMGCLRDSFPTCLAQLDFHSASTSAAQRWRRFGCEQVLINGVGGEDSDQLDTDQQKGECWFLTDRDQQTTMASSSRTTREEQEGEDGDLVEDEDDEYLEDDEEDEEEVEDKEVGLIQAQCSVFGQFHLFRTSPSHPSAGRLEHCAFTGARPLVDNRFFLVQITAADLNKAAGRAELGGPLIVVSKVALIIRPRSGCVERQLLYLADAADAGPVPATFEDGSIGSAGMAHQQSRRPIEIVRQDRGQTVHIRLNYLQAELRVRKFGTAFLNLHLRMPAHLLQQADNHFTADLSSKRQICAHGCQQRHCEEEEKTVTAPTATQPMDEKCVNVSHRLFLVANATNWAWTRAMCIAEIGRQSTVPEELWLTSLMTTIEELDHGDKTNGSALAPRQFVIENGINVAGGHLLDTQTGSSRDNNNYNAEEDCPTVGSPSMSSSTIRRLASYPHSTNAIMMIIIVGHFLLL